MDSNCENVSKLWRDENLKWQLKKSNVMFRKKSLCFLTVFLCKISGLPGIVKEEDICNVYIGIFMLTFLLYFCVPF